MKAPKIGERVAVYGDASISFCPGVTSAGKYVMNGARGEVQEVHQSGWLTISIPTHGSMLVHPKQCRRLKPRAKPREFWIIRDRALFMPTMIQDSPPSGATAGSEVIHVREVRK